MPKNKDINSILIIGSGPIVIGQACEFDYSGSQAAKALKQEGYRVILVNSNPATIMTDPEMADATYIEPLTVNYLKKIIEIEKPDAVLPTLGGQTALNLSMELENENVFDKNDILLLGASAKSIEIAENRWLFKSAMESVGIKTLQAEYVKSIEEGVYASEDIGFPLMLRPSFILGGGGTSLVESKKDLEKKKESKEIHDKINGKVYKVKKLSTENKELYGSVKPTEISKLIHEKENVEINPSNIQPSKEIKSLVGFRLPKLISFLLDNNCEIIVGITARAD